MAASPTTVPAAKLKLLELFKTATEADKTEVWPARTSEDHQLEENVYIGSVRGRREFKVMAAQVLPNSRQEEYTVRVELEVYRQGSDLEAVEARMWELAQALELTVAEHRTLQGVNHLTWAIADEFDQETVPATDGVLAKYVFGVAVTARI